jgi:predicted small metal-binding protein
MATAHRLDCEKEAADCRFIVQFENEDEALDLARSHMKEVHGRDFSNEELRGEYMETV